MVINSYEQYNELKTRMDREMHICTPIFRDLYYHVMENELLCVSITFMNGESFVVSISHEDAPPFEMPVGNAMCFTANSKVLFTQGIDIAAVAYIHQLTVPVVKDFFTTYVADTHNIFNNTRNVNRIIPLAIWDGILTNYNTELLPLVSLYEPSRQYTYMHELLTTLRDIESAGLCVDRTLLLQHFSSDTHRAFKDDMVYTEYNPYTATGRPSNRFAGINFAALNKSDGSRDSFISRYPNGLLVQMDFEAYHLRLMANELGVTLPSEQSIHTELAKVYFNTSDITEEMYAESKRRTFEVMYGMSRETYNFELFEKIHQHRKQYEYTNTIELPSGITVDVGMPNASKLFNYYVQSLEMVRTLPKLTRIIDLIKNTTNHLVLYTYDSILLDMQFMDTSILQQIQEILEENKTFPVRIYSGNTYGNIKEIHFLK
jgi:hypothetical protein